MATSRFISDSVPRLLHFVNARSCGFTVVTNGECSAIDKSLGHCKFFVQAGLYDTKGDLISMSERPGGRGGDLVLSVNPPNWPILDRYTREVRGKSIYLGHFMAQYGHFVVETLSRCWTTGHKSYDNYVFYPFVFNDRRPRILPYQQFFLERLRIPKERVVFLDEPAVFEEIDVPEQLWVIAGEVNSSLSSFYSRISDAEGRPTGTRRLFFSRRQAVFKRLANVAEVEDVFRGAGFEILYPEILDIRAQMAAYRDAAIIAGVPGSAMHNCIFAPRGCKLIEVGDVRSPSRFMLTQQAANELAEVSAHRIPYVESERGCISRDHLSKELYQLIGRERTQSNIESAAVRHWSRSAVLNSITALFPEARYLEIGVNRGETFFAVHAARKVAVDSHFSFDVKAASENYENAMFHEVESDVYFGEVAQEDEKFDLIFLDGMHTFEATLRDFCNSIRFLADNGVIVIDDVVPSSYHASLPDHRTAVGVRQHLFPGTADKSWMGDVYRLVFFIQTFFQQYQFATVAENHGQLVVWKAKRVAADVIFRRVEDISRLPFESTVTDHAVYNKKPFTEIISLLAYYISHGITKT